MALGFGGKKDEDTPSPPENDAKFGNEGYYNGFSPDVEKQGTGGGQEPRKMSRIDRPITSSITGRNSIDNADVSVGQQMEAEAGNAIKYRTCSWQKVSEVALLDCLPSMF